MGGDDIATMEKYVDKLDVKIEKAITLINRVSSDVKVIKSTCETRGGICNDHFKGLEKKLVSVEEDLDATKSNVKPRLQVLESRDTSKEKFLYLVIGALCSGILSIGIFALTKLVG